jgi:hypothetical protein
MRIFNAQGIPKESESIQINRATISSNLVGFSVVAPSSGKKLRIYAIKFSLTEDDISVSFRFNSDGSDFEKICICTIGWFVWIK